MLFKRNSQLALGGVALAGILFASLLYFKPWRQSASSPQYTVAQVDRGALVQSIATTGTLSPLVSVEVSSQISGLITEVAVDFNSTVHKGQFLARIDPATYEEKLAQAKSNLAAALAAHTLNRMNAVRLQGLRRKDLVSQQDLDQAQAVLQQSHANLQTQEATVRSAQTDLERCVITSPIDGVVIYRQADVGKTVVSSFSAPTLFTIARDLAQMRILAPISEVDVWSVQAGQDARFTVDALPGRIFHGRVTQVRAPYTPSENFQRAQQQQSGIASFDSVIEVDNKELLLRPSLTAIVSLVVAERHNVLKVPTGALNVDLSGAPRSAPAPGNSPQTTATVYRLPSGDRSAKPQSLLVRVGITDGVMTEIVSGVSEGDLLITGTTSTWEPEKRSIFN